MWAVRGVLIGLVVVMGCRTPPPTPAIHPLSADEFATTVQTISEPPGYFDSDNFVSNETAYLHIVRTLQQVGAHDGVYVGVGPDQNFTYIARIRPKLAFLVDIRRENLLEHLLFKALFEIARTRQEYLSLLFSKPIRPDAGLGPTPSIQAMVDYFDRTPGDERLYQNTLARLTRSITAYRLNLSPDDFRTIQDTYRAFFTYHLDMRFEFKRPSLNGLNFPVYREFLLEKDLEGHQGNFLNSDDDFAFIKQMSANNLIIPITGDFAGDKALAGVGAYIRDRGEAVSAFYLSNVEFYLVPNGRMDAFVQNVKRLPIHDRSVFIRAFVNLQSASHPERVDQYLLTPTLQYIRSVLRLYDAGRYRTYWDIGTADYIRSR
ncbi:MAG: hypothetical protein HY710_01765, partial [Candidatus Latescibacteria bacterium]|nr:hypothetical protein [Candidatus Latescibacterota bacterium]